MDKETSIIALAIITILAVFVAVQPIIPSNSEHFSELGILGPQQTIANYPSNITKGQAFSLYAYVGNHEGGVEYYQVLVKLVINTSYVISNTTSANAPIISSYSYVLDNGKNTTLPMNLSVNQTGTNLRLLFELWSFDTSSSSFSYTGLTDQLWLNVTTI
ncbi:MAG: DUF1616 domain-containing protein [archaeon]|nr:DUF1616 domain-containing protein [archaeon]